MKALALCLLVGCAWTRAEVAAEAVALTATAADWYQTVGITAACSEANPIVGPCGQRFPVAAYFPLAAAAQLAIAAALPHKARLAWAAATSGAEVNQVWINHELQLLPPPPPATSSTSAVLRRIP